MHSLSVIEREEIMKSVIKREKKKMKKEHEYKVQR